jgi:hypothetical protein
MNTDRLANHLATAEFKDEEIAAVEEINLQP